MPEFSSNYYAFLLRCWREDETSPWRATLEDPHSGEMIGFASLQNLYTFLDQQTGEENIPQDSA